VPDLRPQVRGAEGGPVQLGHVGDHLPRHLAHELVAEQLEELTRALRQEILTLDVESVVPRSGGEAPPGTRGVDAAAIGALVVSVAPALGALARLVTTVVDWLRRGGTQRTVRLKIGDDELELSGAS